jgi:hypothetical protein
MTTFTGELTISLSLTISGKTYKITPGNIKSLELNLYAYGFNSSIGFVVSSEKTSDDLFAPLSQNDLIVLSLTVGAYDTFTADVVTPLSLTGLVSRRAYSEQTLSTVLKTQDQMLYRHYRLEFADPAQVLWKQHFPCDLLTDSTLQALITAHAPTQISLQYDWDVLKVQHPVLALALGSPGNQASFYDYLLWLVDSQNGVFTYDIVKNQYTLSGAKSQDGTAQALDPEEVADFVVEFPEVLRYQPYVLNAYTENPKITAISNASAPAPIRKDNIGRYPIAADMQARVTLETARLKQPLHEVRLAYRSFPLQVAPPGQLVNFQGSSAWSKTLTVHAHTYKVKEWRLSAQPASEDINPTLNQDYGRYHMQHGLLLEHKEELRVALPSYLPPVYPVLVEGKIVSDKGGDTDKSYQFYSDAKKSNNYYQISIPLWNKQNVRAAYQPNMDAGQFYFPPYKNARVLVGLDFDDAYIAAFLDWGVGVGLPLDSQGNHLVMGKSPTSQNILKHSYVDSKPELQIQRTQDKDTELLQFSDGYIILQTMTKEEGG